MIKYIVWVGGCEVGQYNTKEKAEDVLYSWKIVNGYEDTLIEELEEPSND